jgi:hypothetical protein
MFSIIGIYNLLDQFPLSDGAVHSTSSFYVGVPKRYIYHAPHRHVGHQAYTTELEKFNLRKRNKLRKRITGKR